MRCAGKRVTVPNPRDGDIGTDLLSKILRDLSISRAQWESL